MLVERLDKGRLLHEGQPGFRLNVYTLSEFVQGRLREGKTTYAFFLDVQKAGLVETLGHGREG